MNHSSSIFRANDIRGVYGKDFDLDFCEPLAKTVCSLLKNHLAVKNPKILIGYDARQMSPKISDSLAYHLKKRGIDICLAGLVPSPLCYFLIHHYNFDAAIVVTASHNPPEYNGFKFFIHKKITQTNIMPLLKKTFEESRELESSCLTGREIFIDPFTPYIQSLKKEFSFRKKMPFVIDTGNGALGPLAEKTFESFNWPVEILFSEPDGRFPNHHPDPTIEANLSSLKKSIKKNTAPFGAGFDGDGDRLVVVSSQGRSFHGDELASLFIPSLLEKTKDQTIVADVKCSDLFFQFIKDQGGKALMTKSGHALIREHMHNVKAIAAFEFSGHIFFNDRKDRGCDDALYNLFRLLEILEEDSDLEKRMPYYNPFKTKEIRFYAPEKKAEDILNKIQKYLKQNQEELNALDGIRISRSSGWCLFRQSKTEEALTLRFEAYNQKDLKNLKEEFLPFFKDLYQEDNS